MNAAEGKRYGFVNTDNSYYADTKIKYLGLPIADLPSMDISKFFYTAASFIDEAISTGGKLTEMAITWSPLNWTCYNYMIQKYDVIYNLNRYRLDAHHLFHTLCICT